MDHPDDHLSGPVQWSASFESADKGMGRLDAASLVARLEAIVALDREVRQDYGSTMAGHEYVHPWDCVVSITDAKRRLLELVRTIEDAQSEILLVKRSKSVAVLLSNERWWQHLEEIEDLKDRIALLQAGRQEMVPIMDIDPNMWRLVEDPQFEVLVTKECVDQINAAGSPWRWRLLKVLAILTHGSMPTFSEPIRGMPGAHRYKAGTRRLAYKREGNRIIVVRVGRWLVRPEWDRPDRKALRA